MAPCWHGRFVFRRDQRQAQREVINADCANAIVCDGQVVLVDRQADVAAEADGLGSETFRGEVSKRGSRPFTGGKSRTTDSASSAGLFYKGEVDDRDDSLSQGRYRPKAEQKELKASHPWSPEKKLMTPGRGNL